MNTQVPWVPRVHLHVFVSGARLWEKYGNLWPSSLTSEVWKSQSLQWQVEKANNVYKTWRKWTELKKTERISKKSKNWRSNTDERSVTLVNIWLQTNLELALHKI